MSEIKRLLRNTQWICPFNCDNVEDLKYALEHGLWFRTRAIQSKDWFQKISDVNKTEVERQSFGFYFKNKPYKVYDGKTKESEVFCAKLVCVTSRTTRYTKFYRINNCEKDAVHVYAGKELERLILSDLNSWAKMMTPKTMRALSSKWFVPYLHALPNEILFQDGFIEKIKSTMNDGFKSRNASQKLVKTAHNILDDCIAMKKEGKLAFDKCAIK